jgi:hypothetical protein
MSGHPTIDLSELRLDQSFTDGVAVKKQLTTVPVRKPNKQDFVRVHPGEDYRSPVSAIIELKDDRETYLVRSDLASGLVGEISIAVLYTAINRQGVTFLWPVKLPGPDGKINAWHQSAQLAADLAMKQWTSVRANMSLGAYETYVAAANIPDPVWPEVTFAELLNIGFRDKYVQSEDHPLLRRLRGEV